MSADTGKMTPDGMIFGPTKSGKIYLCAKWHRMVGNPHKSVWTISHYEEYLIFSTSDEKNWRDDKNTYWGIKKEFEVIGKHGIDQNIEYRIAKFQIPPNENDVWHGHTTNADRPPDDIIKIWENEAYISKPRAKSIRKGKI